MATVIALTIALLALALSAAAVWAVIVWRREQQSIDALAERLLVDSRISALTGQTLAAMRRAVHNGEWQ